MHFYSIQIKSHISHISIMNDASFPYDIIKKNIGRGSFGKVILGRHKTSQKMVAIKIIKINNNQQCEQRIKNELKISKILRHINIIEYCEAYQKNDCIIIVYEYCDAGTLKNYIEKSLITITNPLDREKASKYYLTQLRDALYYMYTNNIVHRDIKPDNILLKKNGDGNVLKLIDFGFSKKIDIELSNESGGFNMYASMCGTPYYMAPETLLQKKYNLKGDLWSFGILMYQMIYGKLPFDEAHSLNDLKSYIIENTIDFYNTVSVNCINLLKQLLVIDPNTRISWEDFNTHPWFVDYNNFYILTTVIVDEQSLLYTSGVLSCNSLFNVTDQLIEKISFSSNGKKISTEDEGDFILIDLD